MMRAEHAMKAEDGGRVQRDSRRYIEEMWCASFVSSQCANSRARDQKRQDCVLK